MDDSEVNLVRIHRTDQLEDYRYYTSNEGTTTHTKLLYFRTH